MNQESGKNPFSGFRLRSVSSDAPQPEQPSSPFRRGEDDDDDDDNRRQRRPFSFGRGSSDDDDDRRGAPFRRGEGFLGSRPKERPEEKIEEFEAELQLALPPIPEAEIVAYEDLTGFGQLIRLVGQAQEVMGFQSWKQESQRVFLGRGEQKKRDDYEPELVGLDSALATLKEARTWVESRKKGRAAQSTLIERMRAAASDSSSGEEDEIDLAPLEQQIVARAVELKTYSEALSAQQQRVNESWLLPFLNTKTGSKKEEAEIRSSPFEGKGFRGGSFLGRSHSFDANGSYQDAQRVVGSLKSVDIPEIPLFPPFSSELQGFGSLEEVVSYWQTYHDFIVASESYTQDELNSFLEVCKKMAGEVLMLKKLSKKERRELIDLIDSRYEQITRTNERIMEVRELFDKTWVAQLQDIFTTRKPSSPATTGSSRNVFGRQKPETRVSQFTSTARNLLTKMLPFASEEQPSTERTGEEDDDYEDYDDEEDQNDDFDAAAYVKSLDNVEMAKLLFENIDAVIDRDSLPSLPEAVTLDLETLTLDEIDDMRSRAEKWQALDHWSTTGSEGIIAKLRNFQKALSLYNQFGLLDASKHDDIADKIGSRIETIQQYQSAITEQLIAIGQSPELAFLFLEDESALKLMLVKQSLNARRTEELLNQLLAERRQ